MIESVEQKRRWAMFCHLSAFGFFIFPFGNIIIPLIIWSIKKDEDAFVNKEGKESVNFQLSVLIYILALTGFTSMFFVLKRNPSNIETILWIALGIGIALLLFTFISIVMASVRAASGESFRYLLNLRLIK